MNQEFPKVGKFPADFPKVWNVFFQTLETYNPRGQATGRKESQINSISNIMYYAYDLRGNITNEWGATYPVKYEYDDFNRMSTLRTFREETGQPDITQWLYDEATGLVTNKLYADNKGPSYDYWPCGKLKTRTWARGETTAYVYDGLGQLISIDYSSSDTPDITYTYNRIGQKLTASSSVAAYEYEYSPQGVLSNEVVIVNGITNHIVRSMDELGRSIGYNLLVGGTSSTSSVDYGYDDMGRFSTVSSSVSSVSSVVEYDWMDGANLLNGYFAPLSNGNLVVAYEYEAERDYKTVVDNRANGAIVSRYEYVYDRKRGQSGRL